MAVGNDYDGFLNAQTSPSCVRYHTASQTILQKRIREKKPLEEWYVG